MICQKDVETMSMSLKCHYCVLRLFRPNSGTKIDILAISTSFRHLFGKLFLTGKCYLEVAVECDAAPVLVGRREGHEIESLGERGSGGDRAAFPGLQGRDVPRELGVHHGHLAVLHRVHLVTEGNPAANSSCRFWLLTELKIAARCD